MQYIVNGRIFDNIKDAEEFEISLNKASKSLDDEVKIAVDKDVKVLKVLVDGNDSVYIAVGLSGTLNKVDLCHAYAEQLFGKKYNIVYTDNKPELTYNYKIIDVTDEDDCLVKAAIYKYLKSRLDNKGIKANKGVGLTLDNGETVIFYDYFDKFESEEKVNNCFEDSINFSRFLNEFLGF